MSRLIRLLNPVKDERFCVGKSRRVGFFISIVDRYVGAFVDRYVGASLTIS